MKYLINTYLCIFPGMSEMILGMCVGEIREGLIPPEMGFGKKVRWFCLNHL